MVGKPAYIDKTLKREARKMNNRILGTIAMICAPALFIEGVTLPTQNNVTIGIASIVFMLGWACSNIGMQRMQAIGTGLAAKIVLWVQLFGILMAMLFGFLEATEIVAEDNLLFIITDLCWPLSMVFMIVVGIMAIRANRWAGWQRFAPLLCAAWLPVAMLIGMGAANNPALETASSIVGLAWTGVTWFVLALVVRSNATLATRNIEPVASAS
jgi:hypothetical protein